MLAEYACALKDYKNAIALRYPLENQMRHNHKGIDEVLLENRTSNGDDYDDRINTLIDGLSTPETKEGGTDTTD